MSHSALKLGEFLPYLLNRAAEEVSLKFQQHYQDRYSMLRTEWRVLAHLGEHGLMTARDIGKQARIHKTKISRAVAALETKRFLKRTKSENDRRFERLELTKAGISAFDDLSRIAIEFDKELQASLTGIDLVQFQKTLKQLVDQSN